MSAWIKCEEARGMSGVQIAAKITSLATVDARARPLVARDLLRDGTLSAWSPSMERTTRSIGAARAGVLSVLNAPRCTGLPSGARTSRKKSRSRSLLPSPATVSEAADWDGCEPNSIRIRLAR